MHAVNGTRWIIAGGAGFIGSHLCKRLIAEGHEVLCVDNCSTGSRDNVAELLSNHRFTFREHDVTVPIDAEGSHVINLACPAAPVFYQRDPVQTLRTNVLGSLNLLELARHQGALIMQASTSEVYGDPRVHPQHETYHGSVNTVGTRACYTEGKRCAETLFMDYRRQYGVAVKIARIFNTYGPGMSPRDGRVIPTFIMQALNDRPLTLFGEGTQTRSFCFIDDLVEALLGFAETPDAVTGPMNLGNPAEISIAELAETIIDYTNSKSTIVREPLPEGDPHRRKPDIDLARHALGWEPKTAFAEGLRKTIAWYARLNDGYLTDTPSYP